MLSPESFSKHTNRTVQKPGASSSSNSNQNQSQPLGQPELQEHLASKNTDQSTPTAAAVDIQNILSPTSGHRRISQFQSSSAKVSDRNATSPKLLTLGEFLYEKGYLKGVASDVAIISFGKRYQLHKLILSRSSYFASLLSTEWERQGGQDYEIDFGNDQNVTLNAFELALSRLYGHEDLEQERAHITGLLAVSSFLDMPDLVDHCVSEIIKSINTSTIASFLNFSTHNDYGDSSQHIIEACKAFLFTNGYSLSLKFWREIPNDIAGEVVAADGFFVPTEWERAQFLVELYRNKLDQYFEENKVRKLTTPQVQSLKHLRDALNNDIHYCHLTFKQLEALKLYKDERQKPLICKESLQRALWLQTDLKYRILNKSLKDSKLELIKSMNHSSQSVVLQSEEASTQIQQSDNSTESIKHSKDLTSDLESDQLSLSDFDEDSSDDEHGSVYFPIPSDYNGIDSAERRAYAAEDSQVTKFPPFRFSVKFDDISKLKMEKRVYSKTFWYAGSYWNLYIQRVGIKKSQQLGVYLHRSKLNIANISSVLESSLLLEAETRTTSNLGSISEYRTGLTADEIEAIQEIEDPGNELTWQDDHDISDTTMNNLRAQLLRNLSPGPPPPPQLTIRAESPLYEPPVNNAGSSELSSLANNPANSSTALTNTLSRRPEISHPIGTMLDPGRPEYMDIRPVIQAYFEIYTPSRKKGTQLTCFSSAPDSFKFAQSWGWKSSPLCTAAEESMKGGKLVKEGEEPAGLKFMIVLGLV